MNTGQVAPGHRLPSERHLSDALGVSRVSVRHALTELRDEGVLVNSPQRGWYVRHEMVSEPPAMLQSFSEMVAASGGVPTSKVLHIRRRWAHQGEREVLDLDENAQVVDIRRLRGANERPICLEDLVVSESLVGRIQPEDLEDASLYRLLENRGLYPAHSTYAVHAEQALPEWADLLELEPGDAVLVAEEVCHLSDGRPLLTSINHYRGDSYQFRADLFRRLDAPIPSPQSAISPE